MQIASNFLGLNGIFDSIGQGTLIAINNSLGFYHSHTLLRGNKLKIGGEPDAFLINPIENFDGAFGFPAHHRFYLMGAESALFGLDHVSFPFGQPMERSVDIGGRKIAFGAAYPQRAPDFTYQVSSGYRDICAQLEYFRVPPGYETAVSQLEHHFTGRKEIDDMPKDDDGNDMIVRFPTG